MLAHIFQSTFGPTKFIEHQRHFQTKRGGFGMDTVTAPDHGGEHVFLGFPANHFPQIHHILDQDVNGFNHLHSKSRIDQIAAGQSVVQPA